MKFFKINLGPKHAVKFVYLFLSTVCSSVGKYTVCETASIIHFITKLFYISETGGYILHTDLTWFQPMLNYTLSHFQETAEMYFHYLTFQVEINSKKVAMNYMKTWFIIDLISSLPLDYLYQACTGGHHASSFYLTLRILRYTNII